MASYEPLHESREWQSLSLVQRVARFALCYALWLAFAALGLFSAMLIRDAYLGFLPVWGPWVMTGVDRFGILILMLALLSYVLLVEHYLRRGVVLGVLRARTLRLALWHIPITIALYLISITIPRLIA